MIDVSTVNALEFDALCRYDSHNALSSLLELAD